MKNNHVFSKLYYHVIWKTKNMEPYIKFELKNELYNYISKIIINKGWHLLAIGGVEDHIHILVQMEPNSTVSDLVCKIKSNSSKFIRENFLSNFSWQQGYGVFTVDRHSLQKMKKYILNQEEHHKS